MQHAHAGVRSIDHLIGVPVSRIQAGMYIAELDRPWLETPFLFEGLLLREPDDVLTLERYCRTVYVDENLSEPSVQASLRALRAESPEKEPPPPGGRVYRIQRPVEQEFARAHHDYGEARHMILRMMQDEQNWHRNIPQVKDTVSHFAESIMANPSALNWLTRLKDKNEYTAEHCLNVGVLAMVFGRHLGLERAQIEELGLAGMLHDVGKMKVDPAILNKPGKLTDEEFDHIKTHVTRGFIMLEDDPNIPDAVKSACRDHHERINGSGYPHGKGGEEVGMVAKVIAIVDTYDAITSDRVYSKARPSAEALRILYQARREHYDETLVVRFIECIGVYHPGSVVELNNGMVGVVLSMEPDHRLQPRVMVMLDEQKASMPRTVVDLAHQAVAQGEELAIMSVLPPGSYNIRLEGLMESLI